MTDSFPILLSFLGDGDRCHWLTWIHHTAHAQKSSCWNCVKHNYWCGRRTRNRNTRWKGLNFSIYSNSNFKLCSVVGHYSPERNRTVLSHYFTECSRFAFVWYYTYDCQVLHFALKCSRYLLWYCFRVWTVSKGFLKCRVHKSYRHLSMHLPTV